MGGSSTVQSLYPIPTGLPRKENGKTPFSENIAQPYLKCSAEKRGNTVVLSILCQRETVL